MRSPRAAACGAPSTTERRRRDERRAAFVLTPLKRFPRLTAFARAEDSKRALLAGYQAHLAKPFDVAELVLVAADLAKR